MKERGDTVRITVLVTLCRFPWESVTLVLLLLGKEGAGLRELVFCDSKCHAGGTLKLQIIKCFDTFSGRVQIFLT